jgi:hypothetical protein
VPVGGAGIDYGLVCEVFGMFSVWS